MAIIFSLRSLLVFLHCFYQAVSLISCRNRYGSPVDWFIAYKLPKIAYGTPLLGSSLFYVDKSSTFWGILEDISSSESSVASTLDQYYKSLGDHEIFYILYNDEHPDGGKKDFIHGHAKGAAVFDNETGFLLLHSVPNFPSVTQYEYPESGLRNGQSFLCITLNSTSLPILGIHLHYVQPSIYQSHLPVNFAMQYPLLQKVVAMKPFARQTSVFASVQNLWSLNGIPFISFAKYKRFHKDLYTDLVAPTAKESLYVETWLNGPGDMNSSCNASYKVINILSVTIGNFSFTSSKDHSKWAVSDNDAKPFICIGDINRQISQTMRSGGTICLQNERIWRLFRNSIIRTESCGNDKITSKKKSRKIAKFYHNNFLKAKRNPNDFKKSTC